MNRETETRPAAGAPPAQGAGVVLRRARAALDRLPDDLAGHAAERAADRLDRDLLPRTAGELPYLVVGIVGPNNAGKSALFNALAGRSLSPSLPTGGATRRLLGAAAPSLLAALESEPSLARFPLERVAARNGAPLSAALESAEDPAALLLCEVPDLPAGILLIDTPDFDSIHVENRRVSESMLAVADLCVVVTTRHSYRNLGAVTFLAEWLRHGRPWVLVYNEALDEETARDHAATLSEDLGTEPEAVFWQPFDLAVPQGRGPLAPRRLSGAGRAAVERGGESLRNWLAGEARVESLKRRALSASVAQLRDDLEAAAAALGEGEEAAGGALARADARAAELGRAVAQEAMPAAPFLAAFGAVLDRRGSRLNRGLRRGLRAVGARVAGAVRRVTRGRSAADATPAEQRVAALEAGALESGWPVLWEGLARDLGPEGRAPERAALPPALVAALDADLAPARAAAALGEAQAELAGATDYAEFRRHCEQLVEQALDERGFDWDMQLAADLLTVAPLALAALVIVKTGGLGADLGIAGGGLLSTALTERLVRLLGAPLGREARAEWTRVRGDEVAALARASVLRSAGPALCEHAADRAARRHELLELLEELRP